MTTMQRMDSRLVGRGELLKMFGVSRTRLVQITAAADFPQPVADLIGGKIWDLADIQAWAEHKGRVLALLDASSDHAGDA